MVTPERTVQIRQHEPLQLVPDLLFPGQIEHGFMGHAAYRSRPGRHSRRADGALADLQPNKVRSTFVAC